MSADRLSATFAALADPTRRAILARLALGETTVNELARPFKMSGPGGLQAPQGSGAGRPHRARTRGAMAPMPHRAWRAQGVDEWLERYREFWDERFDRLESYLRDVQAKEKKGKRHGRHDR